MRTIAKLISLVALVVITAQNPMTMFARANDAPAATQIWAGTWKGKLEGRPAVTLTITVSDRGPQGSALFYMLKRGHEDTPAIQDETTVPMTNLRVQDKTLNFEVIRKDQSRVGFTLELKSDNAAILRREGGGDASEVEMSKVD